MKQIITWLSKRRLISIHALEKECGIPQGALNKAVNGNPKFLSGKHLPNLKAALKAYGLK